MDVTKQPLDLKEKDSQSLLSRIVPILLKNGLKSTTMDSVAAALGMSKRTLYERFGSKSNMIKEVLGQLERENKEKVTKIFAEADNVMEGMIQVFRYNRDLIGSTNVDFYRDMDRLYKEEREVFDKSRESNHEKMMLIYQRGIDQGMFRSDTDFEVQSRIIRLQMEALKRVEELFPADITLQRVFDGIMVGFLRSIASEKGMKILDKQLTT